MRVSIFGGGTMIAVFSLAGCADGLIYGERTSISVASVRVNDDPAQPVAIKLGFDRDVVLVAPPIGGDFSEEVGDGCGETGSGGDDQEPTAASAGVQQRSVTTSGGESVSQFSTFRVTTAAPLLSAPIAPGGGQEADDLLMVQTRFASGGAALAIACSPEVVAAFMGLQVATPLTSEHATDPAIRRQDAMMAAIRALPDSRALTLVAEPPAPIDPATLQGWDLTNAQDARRALLSWVPSMPLADYDKWETALRQE